MIDRDDWRAKRVLLLQGPVGPYFERLAHELRRSGAEVQKLNFNGGDQFFCPWGTAYTGKLSDWPAWLEQYLVTQRIDAVALFGDRRPVHDKVAALCGALGVACYVYEEGYFRPAYITCELGGVNARSSIPRNADFFRAHAEQEPSLEEMPPDSAYWAMALWTCLYYLFSAVLWVRYRHYTHHRPLRLTECLCWVRGAVRKWWRRVRERHIEQRLKSELSGQFFLVPLQVHNDAQVTHNSSFRSVEAFIADVAASFAVHAPSDVVLVFKHHPMDRAYRNYRRLIRKLGRDLRLQGRLVYIHDQHIPTLLDHALGVVVINSTAGLSALHQGVATIALGDAFYDLAGLTCQAPLAEFWRSPAAHRPDRELYLAFRRWVIKNTQINDNFYAGPLRHARAIGAVPGGSSRNQPPVLSAPPPEKRATPGAGTIAEEIEAKISTDYEQSVRPVCARWVTDVQRALGPLHLPTEQRHDHPGWLSALSARALAAAGIPLPRGSLDFEAPIDCPWWHGPEVLSDGKVYRFFAERAWLDLAVDSPATDLVFIAGFAIRPEALWGLCVRVDGDALQRVEALSIGGGLFRLRYRSRRRYCGVVRVQFFSPFAARVNEIHPQTADRRYLSLMITLPSWEPLSAAEAA